MGLAEYRLPPRGVLVILGMARGVGGGPPPSRVKLCILLCFSVCCSILSFHICFGHVKFCIHFFFILQFVIIYWDEGVGESESESERAGVRGV